MAGSHDGRHVVLLRAVNVGGRRLPMAELRAMLAALGARDVATYLQSGNAVVTAPPRVAVALATGLRAAISERYGFDAPVVVRTADELRATFDANPFLASDPADHLHVAFLSAAPETGRAVDPARSPGDRAHLVGRDLYLVFPNGVAASKLTNAYLDRALGVVATLRNWRTVRALVALLGRD